LTWHSQAMSLLMVLPMAIPKPSHVYLGQQWPCSQAFWQTLMPLHPNPFGWTQLLHLVLQSTMHGSSSGVTGTPTGVLVSSFVSLPCTTWTFVVLVDLVYTIAEPIYVKRRRQLIAIGGLSRVSVDKLSLQNPKGR